jgi:hypothetical protein
MARLAGQEPSSATDYAAAAKRFVDMAGTLSNGLAGIGRWLRKEAIAIWPVFVFFLIGFLLLILLIKLALEQFSVEITVISNALIGALLAAKAALVLDETPLGRSLDHYRRIVAVGAKVLFYGFTSLLLLCLERFLEELHKDHHFAAAFQYEVEHTTRYWILVWVLGISIVFALYFVSVEINERMGEGELWRLFFESPKTAHDSAEPQTSKRTSV